MFDRIDVVPAYKTVCDTIEQEIVSGRLAPGAQLPTETELADQFGITRHTVREGIRMLEQGGLVRREAGRRLFVALPHYAELAPRSSRALLLQHVTFRDLWEVSLDLETCAARCAAGRIDDEQLDRLRANLESMKRTMAAGSSISELDVEFHTIIAEATGNPALLLAREPISLLFYPALEKLFQHLRTRESGPRRLFEAHSRIVAALEAGDAALAADWMHRHLVDFRRGYDVCGFDIDAEVRASAPAATGSAG